MIKIRVLSSQRDESLPRMINKACDHDHMCPHVEQAVTLKFHEAAKKYIYYRMAWNERISEIIKEREKKVINF